MQHDPTPGSQLHPSDPSGPDADRLASADVVQLLNLMGMLGSLRNDPRAWRLEMLTGLLRVLPATAAAAFILRDVGGDSVPTVATHFDAGFQSNAHRQAFLRELNTAPFRDPLSLFTLRRFAAQGSGTLTCLRSDAADDAAWDADVHVLTHRRASGMDDCLMSIHRGVEPEVAYAMYVWHAAVSRPPEGAAGSARSAPPRRFGPRERLLVNILHRGLDWLYSLEEAANRINHASALPPRLRQTLDLLLAGDTERQVAVKMEISVHTVHDYVKALYLHFGVSSRRELMARWIQIGNRGRKEMGE